MTTVYAMRRSRWVRASPAAVYRALLDPAAVARWRTPDGMTGEVHELDARVGGRIRVSLHYDDPGTAGKSAGSTDTYAGTFVELVPDRRVVEVVAFESPDAGYAGEMTITTELRPADGGCEVTMSYAGIPDGIDPADNEAGTRMALRNLAALVAPDDRGADGVRDVDGLRQQLTSEEA